VPQGEGWWIASDGKWYPPYLHPDVLGTQDHPDASAEAISSESTEEPAPARGGAPWPGWEEVAADQGAPGVAHSESLAYPDGWWLASDGNWYPPELHPGGNGQADADVVNTLGGEIPTPAVRTPAVSAPATEPTPATSEAPPAEPDEQPAVEETPTATAPVIVAAATATPATQVVAKPRDFDEELGTWVIARQKLGPPRSARGEDNRRRNNVLAMAAVAALVVGGAVAGIVVGTQSHPGLSAAQIAAQDRRAAKKIVLHLVDMPSGWRPAVPLPSRAPASPDPFTAAARAALDASHPSCRAVSNAFADAAKGADASSTTDYATPLGGLTPAYGSLETDVVFFPSERLARDDIARFASSTPSCIGTAVMILLERDLVPGTKVVTTTVTGRPSGLASGQSGFEFVVTGTVSNSGASFPLRFVVEGAAGSRSVVILYSGSVAGGGASPKLVASFFHKLASQVRSTGAP
jgi:hypothetical protein